MKSLWRYQSHLNDTLLLIASNIIGFSSLIAVIGDSFERVQVDKAFYDAVQKFIILNELNDTYLFLNRNKEIKADPRFVHIVKYAGDSVQNMEWHGRIQNIKEIVQTEVKSIKKEVAGVKQEIEGVKQEIEKQNAEMKQEMEQEIEKQDAGLETRVGKNLVTPRSRKALLVAIFNLSTRTF